MTKLLLLISAFALNLPGSISSAATPPASPDAVVSQYIQAVGGSAAIDSIRTREIRAKRHHGSKLTYFWQKPNKVLLIDGKKKFGYDGGSGWMLSSKKRVSKLPKGGQISLEIDANPLRYAALKQLYSEINAAPGEMLDDRPMNVLVAPNDLGATKFYFDAASHLLCRVEETGETSAYFKHIVDFADYQTLDGVKLPFRITHNSTEPGAKAEELRILKVVHNGPLKPEIFVKPAGASVVLGGKR